MTGRGTTHFIFYFLNLNYCGIHFLGSTYSLIAILGDSVCSIIIINLFFFFGEKRKLNDLKKLINAYVKVTNRVLTHGKERYALKIKQ